jgi:hypothetical protein
MNQFMIGFEWETKKEQGKGEEEKTCSHTNTSALFDRNDLSAEATLLHEFMDLPCDNLVHGLPG